MKYLKIEVAETNKLDSELENAKPHLFITSRGVRLFVFGTFVLGILLASGLYLALYRITELETQVSLQNASTLEQQVAFVQRVRGAAGPPEPQIPEFQEIQVASDVPALGALDAPVTVVEFADFQCSFCKRWHNDTFNLLKKDYIDTGKVKFVYQDFAFLGNESTQAAEASKCAAEQGKFWEYSDYLYKKQNGPGTFTDSALQGYAKALKLNTSQFSSCVTSDRHLVKVEAETEAGRKYGVSGTPTLFVNGRPLVGAQPYANLKVLVDAELAKADNR